MTLNSLPITLSLPKAPLLKIRSFLLRYDAALFALFLSVLSLSAFYFFYQNKLGLAYNDARSHLDIGRRVVEGLKPGLAQLGSVWLPLPHILMIPTIWNDFMWHSGLSGAIQSMMSYVVTGMFIRLLLKKMNVNILGQVVGVLVFALNLNILYLQSTAMTELLLIGTMMIAVYEVVLFHKTGNILHVLKSAFWIMLSTMIRYDGWFLFLYTAALLILYAARTRKYQFVEGLFVLFCTLAGFGIFLWVLWNALIFKDPLYFAFGPYSAHAQQAQLDKAGVLITKKNLQLSVKTYWYSMAFNADVFILAIGFLGAVSLFTDRKLDKNVRIAATTLIAPLLFNVLALYFGHSVLFIQGINGDTWFNVRYGVMMVPSIAVFVGYLIFRWRKLRYVFIGLIALVYFFQFTSVDAVTIDDGRVGSSQKNVSEVSGWLEKHVKGLKGFILISAASHDAVIFSSNLPMTRFIHEGTGTYWISATTSPDRWARWIVMRTNDESDLTFKLIKKSGGISKYTLVNHYPFADIYQLKDEYLKNLNTEQNLPKQR